MNKTYHFEIPLEFIDDPLFVSDEFSNVEDCVNECKLTCEAWGVDYDRPDVKLFLTDDFGETYEECTEEGELAG